MNTERQATSGMIFDCRSDGGIRVGYEDYGVEFFDGGDFECYYTLDAANADALSLALETDREGLEKKLGEFVGEDFDSEKFEKFCKERGIVYYRMTYH